MAVKEASKGLGLPKLPSVEDTRRTIRKIELMGEVNSAALRMWDYHAPHCPGVARCLCLNKDLRGALLALAEHEKGGPVHGY